MIGHFQGLGCLAQGRHDFRGGLGDKIRRGVSLGGIFIPPGRLGDDQVPHLDVFLEGAAGAQADKGDGGDAVGRFDDGDGAGRGADAGGHDRDRDILIDAGIGEELPVFPAHIHPGEAAGDPLGPIRVAAGQDIGGQLPGGAVEVIKPAPGIFGNGTADVHGLNPALCLEKFFRRVRTAHHQSWMMAGETPALRPFRSLWVGRRPMND